MRLIPSDLRESIAGDLHVIAYNVAQRRREIGVRIALGVAAGAIGARIATRAMSALLFGVGAANPLVYLGASLLLSLVSAIALAVPASRATRVDPITALRT